MTETPTKNLVYIQPEDLLPSLQAIGGPVAVTTDHLEVKTPFAVKDMEWNHMDQLHRPTIHKTYLESLQLATGPSFALTLTRVGMFKLFTLMTQVRLGPGQFYQGFTLLNLLYVHIVIQSVPEGEGSRTVLDWYVVSHPFFKFLHGMLIRRLRRLHEVQNEEDTPVRERRATLRRMGYRFGSDNPDFINSSTLTAHVIPPKLAGIHRIPLRETQRGLNRVSAGPIELLVCRNDNQEVTVWTAVCPHEGGPLELGEKCNGAIICPWHGLRQSGVRLSSQHPKGLLGDLKLSLEGEELTVRQDD